MQSRQWLRIQLTWFYWWLSSEGCLILEECIHERYLWFLRAGKFDMKKETITWRPKVAALAWGLSVQNLKWKNKIEWLNAIHWEDDWTTGSSGVWMKSFHALETQAFSFSFHLGQWDGSFPWVILPPLVIGPLFSNLRHWQFWRWIEPSHFLNTGVFLFWVCVMFPLD